MRKLLASLGVLLLPLLSSAQLAVTVAPLKVTGSKVVVPLAMKNNFGEKIESARAVVFLTDENGRTVGQSARWVIGGAADKLGLTAGATNAFNFVVPLAKTPSTGTNLAANVSFTRVVLDGGKVVNASQSVQISH